MNQLLSKKQSNQLDFSDKVFISLLKLVGKDPEQISQLNSTEDLISNLESVSTRVSKQIFEYWSQNKILKIKFDYRQALAKDEPPYNAGYVFQTRVENTRHEATLNFDERSTGFIWFFSFLIWFSQVKKNYGDKIVILLDEPGTSLHGKAQQDLLRYINEKLRPFHQVVYTTHSPFMIDSNNLAGVRTVEDVVQRTHELDDEDEKEEILGTKVGEKALSTSRDTIFPLYTALGIEITQTLFIGKNILLVD